MPDNTVNLESREEREKLLDRLHEEGYQLEERIEASNAHDAKEKLLIKIKEWQSGEVNDDTERLKLIEEITEELEELNRLEDQDTSSEETVPLLKIIPWDAIPEIDRKWLIRAWIPENTVTMLTGQGGTGKSWLTLQILCQIVCGYRDAFLNPNFDASKNIESPKNIILATYEDEPEEIKRRLQALASGMPWITKSMKMIKQHLHIVDMRGIGSIWGPGVGEHIANTGHMLPAGFQLQDICEEKGARLLVIDPLSGAFGNNENDRTTVYDFVSSFRKWADTAQCAVLMIGHLPKSAEGKAAGFSGSTAWEASARSMMMLQKDGEGESAHYLLSHTKSNYAERQDDIYLRRNRYGWWQKVDSEEDAIESYQEYINQNENPQEDTDNDDLYTNPIRP